MKKEKERLSSVRCAVKILLEFTKTNKELGVTELGNRLRMSTSSVFRIVNTLCDEQLLLKNVRTRKYRLWLTAFEIGSAVYNNIELCQVAIPYLNQLHSKLDGVIHLTLYNNGDIIYLLKIPEENRTRTYNSMGKKLPPHCIAAGKLLLAFQSKQEIKCVLENTVFQSFTSKTITDPQMLLEELEKIKDRKYALSIEEYRQNICSVAVPVFGESNDVISSLSLTVSKKNLDLINKKTIQDMQMYSRLISEQLGYV